MECTDYTELYPQIELCENQEECQIKLFDCHWRQWFHRSQFWRNNFRPTDIPTFNMEDGTCDLHENLLNLKKSIIKKLKGHLVFLIGIVLTFDHI